MVFSSKVFYDAHRVTIRTTTAQAANAATTILDESCGATAIGVPKEVDPDVYEVEVELEDRFETHKAEEILSAVYLIAS